jgi:hypothetical protein
LAILLFCAFVFNEVRVAMQEEREDPATVQRRVEREVSQRIAISHVVVLSSIGDISVKGPQLLRAVFETLGTVASGVSTSSSAARCLLGWDIYTEVFADMLLVLALPILVAVGFLFYVMSTRHWQFTDTRLLVGVAVLVFYLKYTSVLQSLLSLFSCTEPLSGGVSFLIADVRMQCYDSTHTTSKVLAALAIAAVGFGVIPGPCPYIFGI